MPPPATKFTTTEDVPMTEILKRKGGRPSKCTPETRRQLVELVAKGVPYKVACAAVRITFQSFSNWRDKDFSFRDDLEQATAKAITRHLEKIQAASDAGEWRASCWWLEHVFPENFSKSRIEVTGADGQPLAAAVAIYLPQKDGATGIPLALPVATVKEENE
jgi:hypothetical protein